MKKIALLVLLSLVLSTFLVACGNKDDSVSKDKGSAKEEKIATLFEKSEKIKDLSYDFIMTSEEEVTKGKNWTKDKWVKNQFMADEEEIIYILDMNKNISYTYLPTKKMAIKMNVKNPENESIKKPSDYIKNINLENAKIVETTTYADEECKVISEVNKDGKEILKMWFSTKSNLPIKVEEGLDSDKKVVMEYKNIKTEKISENIFELPKDVLITDVTK
ncbi:Outer membrane lipoprotein-sorting protein [Desulfonispora thiosulfatigenes DSM 11270]|uniref:Outer membrane lipoprotein-sorting protein n=1 Tax=Desulfonispora thiosulfatigenes DSM 11270 TaxID=656914 RepID=A0A1W1UCZ7_DESTI|nr:hypothetical protein [Desulfonispora thiosulfatigenes]SMB78939.1 Outer membrane lipoprotein-sorting protein [Desulfonispora thiosulfatigenes DSM 11270]